MTQVYKKRVSLQEFSNLVRKIEHGGVGKIIHLHSYGSAKLKDGEYVFLGKLLKHETLSETLPKIEELYGEHQFSIDPYMIKDDELAELLETKKLAEEIVMRTDVRAIPLTKKKIIMDYIGIDSSTLSTKEIDVITCLALALSLHSYRTELKEWFSLKLSRRRMPLFSKKYNLVVKVKEDAIPLVGRLLEE